MPTAAHSDLRLTEPAPGHRWTWLSVVVTAVAFYGPLLWHEALPVAERSDVAFAATISQAFTQSIFDGTAYPRWIGDLNHGYGAPVFIFYSPLAYYAVAAVSVVAHPLLALRIAAFLAALGSGVSFMLSFRKQLAPVAVAAGASLYVAAPYHVLDLYSRFALAEFFAFIWLPPLFACSIDLLERFGWKRWYGLVAAAAGLLLTHSVTAFMSLFVLIPYVVLEAVRRRRWQGIFSVASAGLAAGALSAVYLVPAVLEHESVQIERAVNAPLFDWKRHLLFHDETSLGLPPDPVKPAATAAALAQAWPAAIATIGLVWLRRRGVNNDSLGWITLAAVALGTLLLQTALSAPLWNAGLGLARIAFPWRFGTFEALLSCVLVSIALSAASPWARPGHLALAGFTLLACIPAVLLAASTVWHARFEFDDAAAQDSRWRTAVLAEYVPRGVLPRDLRATETPAAVLEGGGAVDVRHWSAERRLLQVKSPRDTRLELRTFAYPGWEVELDGRPVALEAAGPLRSIAVGVPRGEHEIVARFGSTPARRASAVLSAAAVGACAVHLGAVRLRRRREGR